MSQPQYGVLPVDISTASASCHTTAGEITTQLTNLKNYVIQIGAEWLGFSSTTFQNMMGEYDIYARNLNHALTEIGDALMGNFENYVEMETVINQSMQQLQLNPYEGPANLEPVPTGSTPAPGDITRPS